MFTVFILEIKFLYLYLSFAIASTISLILIFGLKKTDTFKNGIFSYFRYLSILFIIILILFIIFAPKYGVYFDFFITN